VKLSVARADCVDELKRLYFSQIAREAKDAGKVVSRRCAASDAGERSGCSRQAASGDCDFATHLWHYVLMLSSRKSAGR
jgi:hypothetical protein